MADTRSSWASATALRCAISGCAEEATGFYRLDKGAVVIMVGRPRARNEVPLCTAHTWRLSRDIVHRS